MRTSGKLAMIGAVGGLLLAGSGAARALTIDGVTFTPGTTFAVGSFYQNAPSTPGASLTAVGRIDELNNSTAFCAGCELDFYARNFTQTGLVTNPNGSVSGAFSGGQVTFYVAPAGTFNPNAGSMAAAIASATSGTDFLDLTGHAHMSSVAGGTPTLAASVATSGNSVNAFEETQLDVAAGPGAANAAFNTNSINDGIGGFADLLLTSSTNNIFVPLNFALAGSSDVRGVAQGSTPAPEPAAAALLGTSLLGLAALRRRRRRKPSRP